MISRSVSSYLHHYQKCPELGRGGDSAFCVCFPRCNTCAKYSIYQYTGHGVILFGMTGLPRRSLGRNRLLWLRIDIFRMWNTLRKPPTSYLPLVTLALRGRPALYIGLSLCVGVLSCVHIHVDFSVFTIVWPPVCLVRISFAVEIIETKNMDPGPIRPSTLSFEIVCSSVVCA